MGGISRRGAIAGGAMLAGMLTSPGAARRAEARDPNGFMAASGNTHDLPGAPRNISPGLQGVTALCEVTGGGEKVYGIAASYDVPIDPASLSKRTMQAAVVPAAKGFFAGMPDEPDKNAGSQDARSRAVHWIYTNSEPALRPDHTGVPGRHVIVEFAHDADLSIPTGDSDKVTLVQAETVRTTEGGAYAGSTKVWTNTGRHGNSVAIRGVDAWEQNHWWWDDARSTWLEYSIFLPESFLAEGGEQKAYPLLLAVTHSGTSADGTCAQTLTEQCIASIWSLPEEQARHECVVITPRYERTTMNDYWEHTNDVENTYRLVQSLLSNTWNHGNPNLADRRDKVLRIDPARVYCTGWSMGAMTSLWLMAHHPDTFAAGLIIAGQQRPADLVGLADQKVLIITGSDDNKATPWNEQCVPVWRQHGAKVTRPGQQFDPSLIFPVDKQEILTRQIDGALQQGGNITFLTFNGVDHLGSARKFFYLNAARDWLFEQTRKT